MTTKFVATSWLNAEIAHLALGATIVLLFQALRLSWTGAIFLILGVELLKEFVFDTAFENASIDDGVIDLGFWFIGAGLALLVVWGLWPVAIPLVLFVGAVLLYENAQEGRSPGP